MPPPLPPLVSVLPHILCFFKATDTDPLARCPGIVDVPAISVCGQIDTQGSQSGDQGCILPSGATPPTSKPGDI